MNFGFSLFVLPVGGHFKESVLLRLLSLLVGLRAILVVSLYECEVTILPDLVHDLLRHDLCEIGIYS